jgi:hypothetical protein
MTDSFEQKDEIFTTRGTAEQSAFPVGFLALI